MPARVDNAASLVARDDGLVDELVGTAALTTGLGPQRQSEVAVGEGVASIEAERAQRLDLRLEIGSSRRPCAVEPEENHEAVANGFATAFRRIEAAIEAVQPRRLPQGREHLEREVHKVALVALFRHADPRWRAPKRVNGRRVEAQTLPFRIAEHGRLFFRMRACSANASSSAEMASGSRRDRDALGGARSMPAARSGG